MFASVTSEKYVDLFIATVYTFFKDETIVNRDLLYSNQYIYPWIIETIFYYFNNENHGNDQNEKILQSIKKQSILFFGEIFFLLDTL